MNEALYITIGRKIKEIRKEKKFTIADIADEAGVSKGLISKIENGRTIPSLPVLFHILQALDADFTLFFEGISNLDFPGYIHRKASEYEPVQKEDSEGFSYFSIISESIKNAGFQTALLKLAPGATREKVITDGYTFLYLIEGEVDYILDDKVIKFNSGDSLFFDGQIPHVPRNRGKKPALILIVYLLNA